MSAHSRIETSLNSGCAPVYRIDLTPTPDTTDPLGVRRLRGLLKRALRSYGLRCVACERIDGPEVTASGADARGDAVGDVVTDSHKGAAA